jgi:hypothetical protein
MGNVTKRRLPLATVWYLRVAFETALARFGSNQPEASDYRPAILPDVPEL